MLISSMLTVLGVRSGDRTAHSARAPSTSPTFLASIAHRVNQTALVQAIRSVETLDDPSELERLAERRLEHAEREVERWRYVLSAARVRRSTECMK